MVVQFEDFESSKAFPLLSRYRHRYRVFNDDIQGTGCVTLSGVLSAAAQTGQDFTKLRFMCAGAGSAGLGVCGQLMDGLVEAGLTKEEARSRFVICTIEGALGAPSQKKTSHAVGQAAEWVNTAVPDGASLMEAMKAFKPHVLLGLTAQSGIFTEDLIKQMAAYHTRPIILPMSNPTTRAECTPEQAYKWTEGRAVVATGSPFLPCTLNGKTFTSSQCNNMYIFPGLGLAASVAGVSHITDRMLYVAAKACANCVNKEEVSAGMTFPSIKRIREVSFAVANAVIQEALNAGLTTKISQRTLETEGLENLIKRKMYFPNYVPLVDPK